jgi:hypothetical protein
VQPTDAERTLNGFKVPKNRDIDWEAQFAQAIDAFGQNGYFILVNDPQAEALVDGTISRRPRHALHLQDPPRQRQHLMEPNDQDLCIVPARGPVAADSDRLFLPFEGDATLSIIFSKAFLLAADNAITDPTIVRQIALR